MSNLPDRPRREPTAPQLSSEQFEAVIRRAAELQARSAESPGGEGGLSEAEALRIGRELGLSGAHLGQALAEVRGGGVDERGFMASLMGPARLSASRAVPGEAAAIARLLESHLTTQQHLMVQRRFAGTTVYVKASGVVAAVERTTAEIFGRSPRLGVDNLHVTVRPLEPGTCLVGLSTDMSGDRAGYAAGGAALGTTFGGVGALALGIAIAPPAALIALPVLAGSVFSFRLGYQSAARKAAVQLESFLDRLEHGEIRGR